MTFAANPLQPLIDFFEAILVFFHDNVGFGWGMAIVALTVIVRAALLPLTLKQFKSMQNLARVQPEIKKLQEKYKGDKERLNQEMMRFYRENKVNPFSSCLPILAQLPVFFALFYMLQKDLRIDICGQTAKPCGDIASSGGAEQFLFINDLTDKATGGVLVTLIVLYVGSQLLSTILMSTATDRNQKLIMYALPFFFVIFVWQFPAGLLVYWITTNLWTIVQQAIVRRRLGPIRPHDPDSDTPAPTALIDRLTGAHRKHAEPATVGATGGAPAPAPKQRRAAPPPAPPRKKKKRSGRRR